MCPNYIVSYIHILNQIFKFDLMSFDICMSCGCQVAIKDID